MRSRLIASITTAAALAAVGASAALAVPPPAPIPKVPTADGPPGPHDFQVKPSEIVYTGDGSGFLAGRRRPHHHHGPLKWSGWTATGARGSGFNWLDNCHPNCAQGTYTLYHVKLHFWRPVQVGGHMIFTRLTLRYTRTLPPGVHHRRQVWRVFHNSSGFHYKFPPQ